MTQISSTSRPGRETMTTNASVRAGERGTETTAPYRNAALPIRQRVDDLLSRMTLEEKAAQMRCIWRKKAETLIDENGNFDLEKARRVFADGRGIGQVARPSDTGKGKGPREMAELTNAMQKFFVEHT